MMNIPVVKLGLVAVSRDCFPIQLSEKRRAAIAAKCAEKKLPVVEIKKTVENEKDMLAAVHIYVAMGNAWEGIRRMCDFVTDDNDHNGVGKAIRRIVGI